MSSAHWPPKEGLSTVDVPRDQVILQSAAITRVNAPAALVFDAVRNVGDYSLWNSWIPNVSITSQAPEHKDSARLELGTQFTFHVIMNAKKPHSMTETQLVITDVSTPDAPSDYVPEALLADGSFTADLSKVYRIAWKMNGGFAAMGLKAERFHEIVVVSENECEIRDWETQGGILARTVKFMYGKVLAQCFENWNEELKKYSEEKVATAAAS